MRKLKIKQIEKRVLDTLRGLRGVISARLLGDEERRQIIAIEEREEDRIILGMCKSLNEGVREALNRGFTVAMVIDSGEFQYPSHSYMEVLYRDRVVGENVSKEQAAELRKSRRNIFLWENFVLYYDRMPKDLKARREMRIVYRSRPFDPLEALPEVKDSAFGVPSVACDAKVKELLAVENGDPVLGTCLIGFNAIEQAKRSAGD